MNKDSTEIILEGSRFWFQKVLVPIMVCIGVTGNTITVMVLTRSTYCHSLQPYATLDANVTPTAYLLPKCAQDLFKGRRMRSSTNIYLSALAIADIIHLFFVFLLSFKHYNNIHDRRYELYWRFYGLSHWLCDAASSTSVWLTVSFTIERYIAVCHPMKGKYFCTENRAKTVTVIVYIFCLLTTASTTFEYQLNLYDTVTCGECKNVTNASLDNTSVFTGTFTNSTTIHYVPNNIVLTKENYLLNSQNASTIKVFNDPNLTSTLKNILKNCTSNHAHIIYVYPQVINVTQERSIPENTRLEIFPNMTILHQDMKPNVMDKPQSRESDRDVSLLDDEDSNDETSNATHVDMRHCCNITKLFIDVESTILGKNTTYTTFMHWYSAMGFGIVPLVLIATFNCFLVRAVYLSQRKRRTLTNSKSHQNSQENVSVNENRITMMLIAVVVMFLICQTPTASYLIYYSFYTPVTDQEINIRTTLGNVFNFLLTVNASCNFLLYSIMSKKFRSTFKQLFFERSKNKRVDTIALSSTKSHTSQKFNPYHHGIKRNASEYHTPRNLETTSLTSVPRSKSLLARPAGKAKSTDLIV